MTRTVIINREKFSDWWPRVLTCFVCRGKPLPIEGENVILEANGKVVTTEARVEEVDPTQRIYQVRIW